MQKEETHIREVGISADNAETKLKDENTTKTSLVRA